jgi:hypothetical protein
MSRRNTKLEVRLEQVLGELKSFAGGESDETLPWLGLDRVQLD